MLISTFEKFKLVLSALYELLQNTLTLLEENVETDCSF